MCKYHIIFTPKYRRKIIYNKYKESLVQILKDLCKWKGVEIIEGKAKRDHLLIFLLTLISVELATTLWLVPFDGEAILVTVLSLLGSAVAFIAMIRCRRRSLTNIQIGNTNIT